MIHDGFYCNADTPATTSLAAAYAQPSGRARMASQRFRYEPS